MSCPCRHAVAQVEENDLFPVVDETMDNVTIDTTDM